MKNYIKIVSFITLLLIIVIFLNKLFSPIGTYEASWFIPGAMQDMYKQQKNTIDILYVGDSNVYAGISPLEIYNNLGVTGLCVSTPRQDVIGSYYIAKENFKNQDLKVVFIETGEFFLKSDEITELGRRSEIDFFKFSKNKIDFINDKDLNLPLNDKMTYFMPVLKYHTRYDQLTEFDIRKLHNKSEMSYKGYLLEKNVVKGKNYRRNRNNNQLEDDQEIHSTNLDIPEYVDKKIDELKKLCDENNAQLVFLSMPTTDELMEEKYNVLKEYAIKKNVKYLNLNFEIITPIDWEKDTQDGGDHLNIYGAQKVAESISKFISDNFEISNKKEDPKYSSWNEVLEGYNSKK